jgi:hypothetical protein
MTISDIILSGTLFVIIFYTIATFKLASDTKRLADITTQQFRLYWISNMFISFSIRIDAFNEGLKNRGPLLVSHYQEHIDDMIRYFRIFIDLLSESQGKSYLIEKQMEFDQLISNDPFIDDEFIDRMQKYLYSLKEEMQKRIGKLMQS